MDDDYPNPPPPKHRRPFPSPPSPSNSDDAGNYLTSPSSAEEAPPVKRPKVDRHAQGFKLVSRKGTGSNRPDHVKIPADWSKDSTFALIRAWGDRFLMNGKGKLNSDHWARIARDVNEICERKYSVLQCQNRIETLKKMYKKHKNGVLEVSSSSNWDYFEKMDELLGDRPPQLEKRQLRQEPEMPRQFRQEPEMPRQFRQEPEMPGLRFGLDNGDHLNGEEQRYAGSEEEDNYDTNRIHDDNGDSKFRVLADSVRRIEGVFERLESNRKDRAKELEKMRNDFMKELEERRREIFERAQSEIAMIGDGSGDDDREEEEEDEDEGGNDDDDDNNDLNNGDNINGDEDDNEDEDTMDDDDEEDADDDLSN